MGLPVVVSTSPPAPRCRQWYLPVLRAPCNKNPTPLSRDAQPPWARKSNLDSGGYFDWSSAGEKYLVVWHLTANYIKAVCISYSSVYGLDKIPCPISSPLGLVNVLTARWETCNSTKSMLFQPHERGSTWGRARWDSQWVSALLCMYQQCNFWHQQDPITSQASHKFACDEK